MEQLSLSKQIDHAEAREQKSWQNISAGTWTVAVDLSTNLEDPLGRKNGAGAKDKWEKLQQLARDTASSPVKFVVSVASADALVKPAASGELDASASPSEAVTAENVSRLSQLNLFKVDPADTRIDTYLVSDGLITPIATQRSQGTATDVESLLQIADHVAPSEHLGLVIFAHGTGSDAKGIQSDSGQATLSSVRDAIKNGLGQREKLDTLVFDGCLMSTTETADRMQDVSKTLVASADHEIALMDKGTDAITLNKPFQELLHAPNMSANQFAMSFIDEARKGANGIPAKTLYDQKHLRSSVDTLLALDLTKYNAFESSLNAFGNILDASLSIGNNKRVLAEAVKSTPAFPSLADYYNDTQRDTKHFATGVLEKIREGKLFDPDQAVGKAANALLRDQHDMTIGYYGSSKFFQNLGGITTELAVADAASQRHAVWEASFPGDLLNYSHLLKDFSFHDALSQRANAELSLIKMIPDKDQTVNSRKLLLVGRELDVATNQSQYNVAIAKLRSALVGYLNEGDCKAFCKIEITSQALSLVLAGDALWTIWLITIGIINILIH